MNIEHRLIEHGGKPVGDVLSLGRQVVLYTARPTLRDLDGVLFPTFEAAEAAVLARLEDAHDRPRAA